MFGYGFEKKSMQRNVPTKAENGNALLLRRGLDNVI